MGSIGGTIGATMLKPSCNLDPGDLDSDGCGGFRYGKTFVKREVMSFSCYSSNIIEHSNNIFNVN